MFLTNPGLNISTDSFMTLERCFNSGGILTQCFSFKDMHHVIQPWLTKRSLQIGTHQNWSLTALQSWTILRLDYQTLTEQEAHAASQGKECRPDSREQWKWSLDYPSYNQLTCDLRFYKCDLNIWRSLVLLCGQLHQYLHLGSRSHAFLLHRQSLWSLSFVTLPFSTVLSHVQAVGDRSLIFLFEWRFMAGFQGFACYGCGLHLGTAWP